MQKHRLWNRQPVPGRTCVSPLTSCRRGPRGRRAAPLERVAPRAGRGFVIRLQDLESVSVRLGEAAGPSVGTSGALGSLVLDS